MLNNIITLLIVVAGLGLPVQAAVNARLRETVQSPALSALISFAVGALILLVLNLTGVFGRGKLTGLSSVPWWAWTGGFFGAFIVTISVIGIPRVGSGVVVASTVFGQLVAGLLLDSFGLLGVPRVPLSGTRILGAVLLFIGMLLIKSR